MNSIISCAVYFGLIVYQAKCLDNGLALTPPMGWLTWQRYRCITDCTRYPGDCVNEELIKRMARHLVDDGWLQKGYQYIIIDDCWAEIERNPETYRLVADKKRFPSGIKSLSNFVHSLGLKMGIYLDFGSKTCAGYPGSMDYLELDSETLADWEIDYVKMDGCYSDLLIQPLGYEQFRYLLNLTGRPIVFSCSYPAYQPWTDPRNSLNWTKLRNNCNLWRMLGDVEDSWVSVLEIVNSIEKHDKLLAASAGPGHWNDPDMLILGNYGLSPNQERVQLGMWAILAAPLILSVDLENITLYSKNLLQNDWLIRINQDSLGQQATFFGTFQSVKIWIRRLKDFNNGWAVAFLNPSDDSGAPLRISVSLDQLKIPSMFLEYVFPANILPEFALIDAFTGKNFLKIQQNITFEVRINPTGIFLLIVNPIN